MESLCVRHINPTDLKYRMSRSRYLRKVLKKVKFNLIFVFLCDIFLLIQFNEKQHDKWDVRALVQCLLWTIWKQINAKSIQHSEFDTLVIQRAPGPHGERELLSVSVSSGWPIIGGKWTGHRNETLRCLHCDQAGDNRIRLSSGVRADTVASA